MSTVKFAIIGCGLIGKKRAACLPKGALAVVCDLDRVRAESLAATVPGCRAVSDPADVFTSADVDAVIISAVNSALSTLTGDAIRAGKHVLVEKPVAFRASEAEALLALAREKNVIVRTGYNHRFHPAFQKARELADSGALGPLMFIRARYGHGGRIGYDREWRADPKLSGGGELIDQGVHLIDLARWFLGDFTFVDGFAKTYFWDMPVDDNAFLNLRTATDQTAWLHVSCTEWKNTFSFEIYGRDAKLHIEGLGGSYGTERLHFYKMLPEMGPPETTVFEFPRGDQSWRLEVEAFIEDFRLGRTPSPGLADAAAALRVVETIYQKSGYA